MSSYRTYSDPSTRQIFASEITAFIKSLSSELRLGSADIKEILDRLASQNWAEEQDDRQLSLPFGD